MYGQNLVISKMHLGQEFSEMFGDNWSYLMN
jgi:hypothetical protein